MAEIFIEDIELSSEPEPSPKVFVEQLAIDSEGPPSPAIYIDQIALDFDIPADILAALSQVFFDIDVYVERQAKLSEVFFDIDSTGIMPNVFLAGVFVETLTDIPSDVRFASIFLDTDSSFEDTTDLKIFYGSPAQSDPFENRFRQVYKNLDIYLHGQGVGGPDVDIEAFVLLSTDKDVYLSGTMMDPDHVVFYDGALYLLGEGFFGQVHTQSDITLLSSWSWTSVTGDLSQRFTPQVPHDYEPGSGDAVSFTAVDPDLVQISIPDVDVSGVSGQPYLLIRATDTVTDDYDTIVWPMVHALPKLIRLLPPEGFSAGDSSIRYQLLDTAPREGESGYDRPNFGITALGQGDIDSDTEMYCNYIRPGGRKSIRFRVVAGTGDIVRDNIQWSVNDSMQWTDVNLIFNPVVVDDTPVEQSWDGVLSGDPLSPEEVDFSIFLDDNVIGLLNEGDNKILVRAVDQDGNKIVAPVTVIKTDGIISIVIDPKGSKVKTDPGTGKHYSRDMDGDLDVGVEVEED